MYLILIEKGANQYYVWYYYYEYWNLIYIILYFLLCIIGKIYVVTILTSL
jgi:hypothetical protein